MNETPDGFKAWWRQTHWIGKLLLLSTLGFFVTAGVVAVASIDRSGGGGGGGNPPPPPRVETSRDKPSVGYARMICERAVEEQLVSPASADFARPRVLSETGSDVQGYRLVLAGHVDAQNRLGAVVRMNYSCTVSGRGDQLRVLDLDIRQ